MIQYDSINLSNFELDSDNQLSDEYADTDGKIIATLGTDCKVYPTAEGTKIAQLNNLMNYKIRTMEDYSSKAFPSINMPESVADLGKKMLQYARDSNLAGVKSTISRGAAFTADWLGMTALHFAAMNNQYEICEIVLNGGVNKDLKTKVDRTPLHLACYYGHYRIVELLLFRKCNINARDMLNMTPLHWAVEKGFKSIVRLLLRHNADVSIVSKFGRTPIAIAVLTEQADILEELKAAKIKQMSRICNEEREKETSDAVNSIITGTNDENEKTKINNNNNSEQSIKKNTDDFHDLPFIENIKVETGILTEPELELFQSPLAMSLSNDDDTINNAINNNTANINSEKKDIKQSITINSNNVNNDLINSNNNNNNNNNSNQQNINNSNSSNNNSNYNISSKIKSIVPVRFKNGKMSPLHKVTYVNKIRPNIISRCRDSNASTITTATNNNSSNNNTTTTTNTSKSKNIRIISLNDFNKLYGDANLKNVQKLPTNSTRGTFICSQRVVNLRDLQTRPQQVKLPIAYNNSSNNSKSTGSSNNNNITTNKTTNSNINNTSNRLSTGSNNKNIINHNNSNSSIHQNNSKRININVLNGSELQKNSSLSSESDIVEEKRLPIRNIAKLDSSSTTKDNTDATSSGSKTVQTKSLRLVPARSLEQFVNLKIRQLPTSATLKQYSSNQRQANGERKLLTTNSNIGNTTTSVVPLLTLPEICRQLLELRRQNDELRRKFELAQRDKDELKKRLQRLEELLIEPKSDHL